jgi:hypothetical protein
MQRVAIPHSMMHHGRYWPESNVPMSFVLENSIMVARAMDQCTALYMLESSFIATRMRTVFIALVAISFLIEIVLVAVIFRRAVAQEFDAVYKAVEGLKEVSASLSSTRINLLKNAKLAARRSTRRAAKAAAGLLGVQDGDEDDAESIDADSDGDSSSGSGESEDSSRGSNSSKGTKKTKSRQSLRRGESRSVAGRADIKVVSHTWQQIFIMLISASCMLFMLALLGILSFLCVRVIDTAESVGGEINSSCRRSFLAERMAYLSFELVHTGPEARLHDESLLSGEITWLRSADIIRCQVDRTVASMLSVHYALLYGKAAGWLDMAQGFDRGPVREWGVGGSVDMCSPFTWEKEGFEKTQQISGSFGRFKPQDDLLFTANCLTELPEEVVPKSSFTFTHRRVQVLSKAFIDGGKKCRQFRQRCRYLDEQQFADLSSAEKRIQFTSQSRKLNLPLTDSVYTSTIQCQPGSEGNTSGKVRFAPPPGPIPSKRR